MLLLLLAVAAVSFGGGLLLGRWHRQAPRYTVAPPLTWSSTGEALVEVDRGMNEERG